MALCLTDSVSNHPELRSVHLQLIAEVDFLRDPRNPSVCLSVDATAARQIYLTTKPGLDSMY